MRGTLSKLAGRLEDGVRYELVLGEERLDLNARIGGPLTLTHTGQIFCDACGRRTAKSYAQGHCFPCMKRLARCDMCVLKPETCHFAAGTCREPDWGERHCMVPHVVYLANTSAAKIGITRASQVPTRWIDQGASQALPIAEVSTRHVAGLVEVAIARSMADKTNWRALLRGPGEPLDLRSLAARALASIDRDLETIRTLHGADAVRPVEAEPLSIDYPVTRYPERIGSHNFDKQPEVGGILEGIKGQYLMFDSGVINVRKFTGYEIEVDAPG